MIELPEALTLARQMTDTLVGKQIASAQRGNAPHKFAFYTDSAEAYAELLRGRTLGPSTTHSNMILLSVEPDLVLILGGGGERILYHADGQSNPAKHQLLLRFTGGDGLSVTVQGWGCVQLMRRAELAGHLYVGKAGVSPLSDDFTYAYFNGLFAALAPGDPRSVKFFCISQPGLWGVGNGYLQDILFRARLHPKRRAGDLGTGERQALYRAVRDTLQQAAALNGRDTERDLFNRPGGYRRILESSKVGRPCPTCGTPIEKIQFLGGAAYFCPRCQVEQPTVVAGRAPI